MKEALFSELPSAFGHQNVTIGEVGAAGAQQSSAPVPRLRYLREAVTAASQKGRQGTATRTVIDPRSISVRASKACSRVEAGSVLWPPMAGLLHAAAEHVDSLAAVDPQAGSLLPALLATDYPLLCEYSWMPCPSSSSSQVVLNGLTFSNGLSGVSQCEFVGPAPGTVRTTSNVHMAQVLVTVSGRKSSGGRPRRTAVYLQVPLLVFFASRDLLPGDVLQAHLFESEKSIVDSSAEYRQHLIDGFNVVQEPLWMQQELAVVSNLAEALSHRRRSETVGALTQQLEWLKAQTQTKLDAARARQSEAMACQAASQRLQAQQQRWRAKQAATQQAFEQVQRTLRLAPARKMLGYISQGHQSLGPTVSAAAHEQVRARLFHARHCLGRQFMLDVKPNPLEISEAAQDNLFRSVDFSLTDGEEVHITNRELDAALRLRTATVDKAAAASDVYRSQARSLQAAELFAQVVSPSVSKESKRLRALQVQLNSVRKRAQKSALAPLLEVGGSALPLPTPDPSFLMVWGPQPLEFHVEIACTRRMWTVFALTVLGLTPGDLLWLRRHLMFREDPARRWYREVHLPRMQESGRDSSGGQQFVRDLLCSTPAWAAVSDRMAPAHRTRWEHVSQCGLDPALRPKGMSTPLPCDESAGAQEACQSHAASSHTPVGSVNRLLRHWKPTIGIPSAQQQQAAEDTYAGKFVAHDLVFDLPPLPGYIRTITPGLLLRACQRSPSLRRLVSSSKPAAFHLSGWEDMDSMLRHFRGEGMGSEDEADAETVLSEAGAAEEAVPHHIGAAKPLEEAPQSTWHPHSDSIRTLLREVFVDGVAAAGLSAASVEPLPLADEVMLQSLQCCVAVREDGHLEPESPLHLQWDHYPQAALQASRGKAAVPLRTVRRLGSSSLAFQHLSQPRRQGPSDRAQSVTKESGFNRSTSTAFQARSSGGYLGQPSGYAAAFSAHQSSPENVLRDARALVVPTPFEAACAAAIVADEGFLRELAHHRCNGVVLREDSREGGEAQGTATGTYTDAASSGSAPYHMQHEDWQSVGEGESDEDPDFDDTLPAALPGDPTLADTIHGCRAHKWFATANVPSGPAGDRNMERMRRLVTQRDFASAPMSVRIVAVLAGVGLDALRQGVMAWSFRHQLCFPKLLKHVHDKFDGGRLRESVYVDPDTRAAVDGLLGQQLAYRCEAQPVFGVLRACWAVCQQIRSSRTLFQEDHTTRFNSLLRLLSGDCSQHERASFSQSFRPKEGQLWASALLSHSASLLASAARWQVCLGSGPEAQSLWLALKVGEAKRTARDQVRKQARAAEVAHADLRHRAVTAGASAGEGHSASRGTATSPCPPPPKRVAVSAQTGPDSVFSLGEGEAVEATADGQSDGVPSIPSAARGDSVSMSSRDRQQGSASAERVDQQLSARLLSAVFVDSHSANGGTTGAWQGNLGPQVGGEAGEEEGFDDSVFCPPK